MLSIIVSTLVFFVAAWYLNRYLNEQEIAEGMTRRILVLVLASVVSFVVGMGLDSLVGNPESPPSMTVLPAVPSQSE
jgi:uncharacterized membrane protein